MAPPELARSYSTRPAVRQPSVTASQSIVRLPPLSTPTGHPHERSFLSRTPHCLLLRNDVEKAKAGYTEVLGHPPYFDDRSSRLNVGGSNSVSGPTEGRRRRGRLRVSLLGVVDAEAGWNRLLELGATAHEAIQDVGDGIKIGSVHDPFGNVLGIIENRHFSAT